MSFRYRNAAAAVVSLIVGVFAIFALASPASATTPDTTTSSGPSRECVDAFGDGYVGFKIDDVNEGHLNGTYTDPSTGFSVTVSNTNSSDHTFDYVSSWPANVIVKGGPDQGELYFPPSSSGTGLHPPVNPNNGTYYGVSHITFCWQPGGPTGPTSPTGPTGPTSPTGPTGPTSPTGPTGPTGQPKLKITKISDNPVVSDGDSVTFTLSVKNEGTAASENTVINDLVPVGLTVNSADSSCTTSGQQVQCVIGSLAAGQTQTFQVHTTATVLTVDTTNDQLTIGKVEQHVSIQAGQTQTAQITCGPDGIMSDGAVRVDSVDQGTGDLNSVEVHKLKSISESTYEATVTNHATGQAQVKLLGVCLPKFTTGGHELLVSAPVTQTVVLNQGVHTVNLTCGAGYTPIAPGLQVTGGRAYVIASAPNGATGRKVTLRIDQNNTTAEVSIRCLSNTTGAVDGGTSELQFTPITRTIQVGAGQTVNEQLTCGDNAKGIVAGWEYDDELVQLGNDPQPKTRVFRIWNPTNHPLNATLYLLCLEARTGTPGGSNSYVNTATVSSSSSQASGAQLSDDASVTVGPQGSSSRSAVAPVGASLTGSSLKIKLSSSAKVKAVVRSNRKFRIGNRHFRKGSVLGKRAHGTVSRTARVKLKRAAVKAIKTGKVRRVKVTITFHGKKKSKALRIKRK
ncbi:MAG: DUF11 domain-containing protein [Thermoleophilia bacterium]|nr:DUF11 domain-containing protein [Thermoleophilia bacterium]